MSWVVKGSGVRHSAKFTGISYHSEIFESAGNFCVYRE